MLPAAHRITRGEDFRHAVRHGRRQGGRRLVLHLHREPVASDGPARVGFVVGRAVGNAVVRNRVKRRLRHLVRDHLDSLPSASLVVVRALPAAADASAAQLDRDLTRALDRLGVPTLARAS